MQGLTLEVALERLADLIPLLAVAIIGAALLELAVYMFFTRVIKSRHALPYTLIAPAAVALTLFTLYPFLYNIRLAFSDLRLKTIACYIPAEDITNAPCSLGQAAINADVEARLNELPVREEPSEAAPVVFTLQQGDVIHIASRSKTSDYVLEIGRPNCVPPTPACLEERRLFDLAYFTQDTRDWWKVETEDGEEGWIPNVTFFMPAEADVYAESNGQGDVVGTLASGSEVRLVTREGTNWYQIRTSDGVTGWVNVKPAEIQLFVPSAEFTLYRQQSTVSEVVETVAADAEGVRLLRDPEQTTLIWYAVATDSGDAWVNSELNEIDNYHVSEDTPIFADMSASSETVGTLESGEEARVLSTVTETWYEVDVLGLEADFSGWVNVQPQTVEGFTMLEDRQVYADSSEESAVLGEVAANAVVGSLDSRTVEGEIWYRINTSNGIVGWVQVEPPELTDIVILPAEAALYSAPGGEAPVLLDPDAAEDEQAPLPIGTQVTEIDTTEISWYQLFLSADVRGWTKQEPGDISQLYFTTAETPAYAAFGDTSNIVTMIPEDTQVNVTGTQAEAWYQVQTADRAVGWTTVPPVEVRTVFAAGEDGDVFAEPNNLAESIASVGQGDQVEPLGSQEIFWYEIRATDGTIGWVNAQPRQEITTEREIVLYSLHYGWENFKRVFVNTDPNTGEVLGWGRLLQTENSTFPRLMRTTLLWTTFNVFFHVVFGMILALMLNVEGLKLKGVYRAIIILPWAVPQVIVALIWRGEFDYQFGFVNTLLGQLGIDPINWKFSATPAFIAVTFVNIWLGIPFYMVTLLGGLQSIGGDYYEAAAIDGANAFERFRNITVPLIRPVAVPIITLDVIWTFNNFNVIFLITEGGPSERTNILVTALYNAAFGANGQFQLGFAAAFSLVIFFVLFLFAVVWVTQSGALKGIYER